MREGPFEYFDAVWYKTSRTLGTSSWIDAYDDYNEDEYSDEDDEYYADDHEEGYDSREPYDEDNE